MIISSPFRSISSGISIRSYAKSDGIRTACEFPFLNMRVVCINLSKRINLIKPLPENIAQEVLDFALFLRQREEKYEWQNLMLAQASAFIDWDNDEDEIWNNVSEI